MVHHSPKRTFPKKRKRFFFAPFWALFPTPGGTPARRLPKNERPRQEKRGLLFFISVFSPRRLLCAKNRTAKQKLPVFVWTTKGFWGCSSLCFFGPGKKSRPVGFRSLAPFSVPIPCDHPYPCALRCPSKNDGARSPDSASECSAVRSPQSSCSAWRLSTARSWRGDF